jgi:hypothetical protein
MFVLTKEEKRVVCFVLLAAMVGLGVKEYRRIHSSPNPAPGSLKHALNSFSARRVTSPPRPSVSPQPPDSMGEKQ